MLPGIGDADKAAGSAARTQSLYRKYRPTSFDSDELVGQDHIVRTLRNAIARERVAHAYLFCGPRGTGKTSTARLLAKAVNCLDPDPERRPCNACEACQAINEGRATDIIEIDAASNRGIEDIRELREQVRYAPAQLRTKFYIIDEAHQITRDAFNAFLKTLEEPPPNTVFVLATTDPDKLPETIASRCQRFDFRRIPADVIAQHVRGVCEREGIQIDDDALDIVVRRAFGGMRDALSLVDQLATSAGETTNGVITVELVRSMLGISAEGFEYDLAQALAGRDVAGGLQVISRAVDAGQDMRAFGRRALDLLRVMMLVCAGADPVEAKGNQRLIDLAGRFELPDLLAINRHFHDIDYKIRTGGFPQLPIELAFLASLVEQPRRAAPLQTIAPTQSEASRPAQPAASPRQSQRPEPAQASQSAPARDRVPRQRASHDDPATAPPGPPAGSSWSAPRSNEPAQQPAQSSANKPARPARSGPPAAILQTLISSWERVRMEVRAVDRKAEALMHDTDPIEVQGDDLRIVATYPFHAGKLNEPRMREVIETAIEKVIGSRLIVTVIARDDFQPSSTAAPMMVQESPGDWGAAAVSSSPSSEVSNGQRNGNGSNDSPSVVEQTHPIVSAGGEWDDSELPEAVHNAKVAFDAEPLAPDEAAQFLNKAP